MNTTTFDGGLKRQFILPVAIVLSTHAALFLGFVKSPAMPHLNPSRSPETESKVIDVPLPDEITVQKSDDPSHDSSSQAQRPEIQNPISPDPTDKQEITITSEPRTMSPIGPIIGPWSPPGGPGNGIGSPEQTFSPDMLDRSPEAVRQPQPIYPLDAKNKGEGGKVVVVFVVDESGRVLNPRVVSSSDSVFEAPTLRAIEQWRFAPGTLHGVPVRFRMSVPVAFTLNG